MDYGRLQHSWNRSRRRGVVVVVISIVVLVFIAGIVSTLAVMLARTHRQYNSVATHLKPTRAISRTCGRTRNPSLCTSTLLDFPGSVTATERELVHISVNVSLHHFTRALHHSSDLAIHSMTIRARSAFVDCMELLENSVTAISRSLSVIWSPDSADDVLTWMSAAVTNQDTCTDGFEDVVGEVKDLMAEKVRDLSDLASISLSIFSASYPSRRSRRRLMPSRVDNSGEFPIWLERRERRLLSSPLLEIQADMIVSGDGNGTHTTITDAVKDVPEFSDRRIIIYVRAGRYEENNLKVGMKKINIMFIGDGKGRTIISGGKSVFDNVTTFRTASFAVTGAGFIARDITFENWAGPEKHQAVALRVGADRSVIYRCDIVGYQDTLYVHSNRQFYRDCEIHGTVDFIFGNAAVVFQNCSIYARKPMPFQKNAITAQNRRDPDQNTGISIHGCRILASTELEDAKLVFPTYLGRPWKCYSRVVYMLSYMGDHIHPRGWLEWNESAFASDTLYYGEYMNYGPGSNTTQRVNWPGYATITSPIEADKFTVDHFICGSSWLPSTGVAYMAGLTI